MRRVRESQRDQLCCIIPLKPQHECTTAAAVVAANLRGGKINSHRQDFLLEIFWKILKLSGIQMHPQVRKLT